jgi:hypothetical protein
MKQRLLTQLVQAPNDLDYVQHFQVLAAVNLEIRRQGPNAERLLRKAILELDVGNFGAGLTAAQDAVALDALRAEPHYHIGMAYLLLALVKAGAIPAGPGHAEQPDESVTGLVLRAVDGLAQAAKLNTGDEETQADVETLKALLKAHSSDRGLAQALRGSV